jgi:catechol 2,3-dioxygenase-like lactoylglutathione lyase family enzyme
VSRGSDIRATSGEDQDLIGRLHHVIIDCPDPSALADFYSQLLGLPVTCASPDWVVVAANDTTSGIAFQPAPGHRPPTWPDPAIPQQLHLDVMVDDVAAASPAASPPSQAQPGRRLRGDEPGPDGWLPRRIRCAGLPSLRYIRTSSKRSSPTSMTSGSRPHSVKPASS